MWSCTADNKTQDNDTICPNILVEPFTIAAMPEKTMMDLTENRKPSHTLPIDGGDCEDVLGKLGQYGIDIEFIAQKMQKKAMDEKVKSWIDLMSAIGSKCAALKTKELAEKG